MNPRSQGTAMRAIMWLLATLVFVLTVGVVSAVQADAATTPAPVKGPGITLTGGRNHPTPLHAGAWKYQGKNLVCISYGLSGPDGTIRSISSSIGLAKADAAWANTVVNLYGGATDNATWAALWTALAQRIADHATAQPSADMRARAAKLKADLPGYRTQLKRVSPAADALATRMLTTPAGPFTARVTLTGATPGRPGSAVLTVTGQGGKPAPGLPVSWALSGGTVKAAGKTTGTAGRASLAFIAAGLGQTVTATVSAPRHDAVLVNTPTAGHQIVLGRLGSTTVKASDAAELCPVSATLTKTCPCKKGTAHTYRYTFTAEDLPGDYVVWLDVDGAAMDSADLAPGRSVTLTATIKAGQTVRAMYSIIDSAGRALWTDVLDTEVAR